MSIRTTPAILAAGSLKGPFSGVGGVFSDWMPEPAFQFGASGTIAGTIEEGTAWSLYCSANTCHPERLVTLGFAAGPPVVFAGNALALLIRKSDWPGVTDPVSILHDPKARIGMSTPGLDPSGDYAEHLFGRLATEFPDQRESLSGRTAIVTGGGEARSIVSDNGTYAGALEQGIVDAMIAYRTVCMDACSRSGSLRFLTFPPEFEIGARFAAVVPKMPSRQSKRLLAHLVGPVGQARLQSFGFDSADSVRTISIDAISRQ